jgi:aryl-alcohol dehydrogenase-like predicted oxidoreductase
VPRDEQLAAVKSLLDDKIIRHAGLSNVSVEDIEIKGQVVRGSWEDFTGVSDDPTNKVTSELDANFSA